MYLLLLLCLPSDNDKHELQRWSLINKRALPKEENQEGKLRTNSAHLPSLCLLHFALLVIPSSSFTCALHFMLFTPYAVRVQAPSPCRRWGQSLHWSFRYPTACSTSSNSTLFSHKRRLEKREKAEGTEQFMPQFTFIPRAEQSLHRCELHTSFHYWNENSKTTPFDV